jgi:hypothetical protein
MLYNEVAKRLKVLNGVPWWLKRGFIRWIDGKAQMSEAKKEL